MSAYGPTRDIEYFNSTTLYSLSNSGSYGVIQKINSTTDSITTVLTTNSANYYMSTDVVNNRLFYTSYNYTNSSYETNSFNTLTNSITDTYSSSSGHYRIKYAPNSNKVYTVSSYYDVNVLNADDLSLVTTLTFSSYVNNIEYNPCTEQIYITSFDSSEIYVVDTLSDSIINTIPTPTNPILIKYNSSDNKMYLTGQGPSVMVLNPEINWIIIYNNINPSNGFSSNDFTFYPTQAHLR